MREEKFLKSHGSRKKNQLLVPRQTMWEKRGPIISKIRLVVLVFRRRTSAGDEASGPQGRYKTNGGKS